MLSTYSYRRPLDANGLLEETVVTGEGGGFLVVLEELGRKAYLKPTRRDDGARAAREKIASDLAADLEINVPPVLLARREDAGDDEEHVCLSLVMFPLQFSWAQLEFALTRRGSSLDLVRSTLPAPAAAAFVFDVWVMQPDHESPHNIIFGYDSSDTESGQLIFLDYSLAFGPNSEWATRQGRKRFMKFVPYPSYLRHRMAPEVVLATIERIERYPDRLLDEIVDRIPPSYLNPDEARHIKTGLRYRRSRLRDSLASFVE